MNPLRILFPFKLYHILSQNVIMCSYWFYSFLIFYEISPRDQVIEATAKEP